MREIPNFLIIGAQKAGTSSLYSYLNKHPDIFMSTPVKEPGFFLPFDEVKKDYAEKWIKTYRKKLNSKEDLLKNYMKDGYNGENYFGEASTYYTHSNQSDKFEIPKKIHQIKPDMKFIYILRNPLSRIVSNYVMRFNRKNTTDSFNDHLHTCISTSLYWNQLNKYLKYFSKTQFKIIIFEEFISNYQTTLSEIFTFLGVSDYIYDEKFKILHKSDKSKFSNIELKYSINNYNKIIKLIIDDKLKMENFLNKSIDVWDLSSESWT